MPTRAVNTHPAQRPALSFPVAVRCHGIEINSSERDNVGRRIGFKLQKFARRIERVSVRFEDLNGPKGGEDKVCRIKVELRGLPTVIAEQHHAEVHAACDLAAARAEHAVRHAVDRLRG